MVTQVETLPSAVDPTLVPGTRPGTYRYPFNIPDNESGPIHWLKLPSPIGFEQADPTFENSQLYVKPGFDLQEAILKNRGLIIEIAGPTMRGYHALAGIDLPSPPIITNSPELVEEKAQASHINEVRDYAHVRIDARELPYKDGSIGLLMVSCLTKMNFKTIELINTGKASQDELMRSLAYRYTFAIEYGRAWRENHKEAAAKYTTADIAWAKETTKFSPRLGLWSECVSKVREGGLIVMQGAMPCDVELGEALGFEVVAHEAFKLNRGEIEEPHSFVFRKVKGDVALTRNRLYTARGAYDLATMTLGAIVDRPLSYGEKVLGSRSSDSRVDQITFQ
jgi:hypothetical protein